MKSNAPSVRACRATLKWRVESHESRPPLPSPPRRQWKVFSNRRFLPQSSHGFSRGSCNRPDDSSDTGKQEGDAAPIGSFPKECKPKPCAQPSSEQGQPDYPCNQCHGRTFPVRDRSIGPSTPPRSYHLSLCVAKSASARVENGLPKVRRVTLESTSPAVVLAKSRPARCRPSCRELTESGTAADARAGPMIRRSDGPSDPPRGADTAGFAPRT